jgi:hypothetical protein
MFFGDDAFACVPGGDRIEWSNIARGHRMALPLTVDAYVAAGRAEPEATESVG